MQPTYSTKQILVGAWINLANPQLADAPATQTIKNPSPGFVKMLEQDDIRRKSAKQQAGLSDLGKRKPRGPSLLLSNGQIDLDALAARLNKLTPTNALTVARLIKKNGPLELSVIESPGAFEFDLSECPDPLIAEIADAVNNMDE